MMTARGLNAGLLAALLAVGTLAGCAARKPNEANWQNPNVAKEEWSYDIGDCRRFARQEVRRAVGPTAATAPADNLGGGAETYNRQMTNYDLSRLEERTFTTCMRQKGYSPIAE